MANKQGNRCIGGTGFDSVLSEMESVGKIAQLLKILRLTMHAAHPYEYV